MGADETAASARKRLQAKLSLSDEELAKWKLAVISFGRVEYLEDDEVVNVPPPGVPSNYLGVHPLQ